MSFYKRRGVRKRVQMISKIILGVIGLKFLTLNKFWVKWFVKFSRFLFDSSLINILWFYIKQIKPSRQSTQSLTLIYRNHGCKDLTRNKIAENLYRYFFVKINKRTQYVCLRSLLFAKMLRFGVRNVSMSYFVDKFTQFIIKK